MKSKDERFFTQSITLSIFALALLIGLAYLLRGVLAPVLFAFLLAYAFDPFVEILCRRHVSRSVASSICLLFLLVLGSGLLALILPTVQAEVNILLKNMPIYIEKIQTSVLPWIENTFDLTLPKTLQEALNALRQNLPNVSSDMAKPLAGLLKTILSSTMSLLASLVYLVIIPLFTYYFLRDFPRIIHWFGELIPIRFREKSTSIFGELNSVLAGFIRGQLTVCAILALFYSICLSLVGVPAGLTIGILAGLFNLVPYLGTITGIALSFSFLLLEGGQPLAYLLVLLVFIGASILDGLLITPKVLGEKLGLAPVAVILAVLAFGEIFGFTGILLAVPVTALGKVILTHALKAYRNSRMYTQTPPPAEE